MVGVNAVAADTDAEARRLFTSVQQAFLNLTRGAPGLLPPPVESMAGLWSPAERVHVELFYVDEPPPELVRAVAVAEGETSDVTLVLDGLVRVEHDGGVLDVPAGSAVLTRAGERVRYTTPDGAEYVAVCLPAFAPDTVHREAG